MLVQARLGLQFDAARARLALGDLEGAVQRVEGQHVGLGDLETGQGQQDVVGRLVFHADLPLLAFARIEAGTAAIDPRIGQEGFRVADIGRQAETGQVGHAQFAGEGMLLDVGG
ncbi:hypothetical protein D3C81_1391950 [compost metagenome]